MTTLIRNGTVVSATGSHRIEVLVDGQPAMERLSFDNLVMLFPY